MNDDRDAWLDDVRRWYYGGTPPIEAPGDLAMSGLPSQQSADSARAVASSRVTCHATLERPAP